MWICQVLQFCLLVHSFLFVGANDDVAHKTADETPIASGTSVDNPITEGVITQLDRVLSSQTKREEELLKLSVEVNSKEEKDSTKKSAIVRTKNKADPTSKRNSRITLGEYTPPWNVPFISLRRWHSVLKSPANLFNYKRMLRRRPFLLEVLPEEQIFRFSSQFFKSLSDWPENRNSVICSLCWRMVLTLLSFAGYGKTRLEISTHIDVDIKDKELNFDYYLALKNEIEANSIKMAAELVINNSYKLKSPFAKVAKDIFGVEVIVTNVTKFLEGKLGFSSVKTEEFQKKDDWKMILAMESTFQGNWENKFSSEDSFIGDFFVNDETKRAIYMVQEGEFYYLRKPKHHIEILELPYSDKDLSLLIYLPSPRLSLAALENYLAKVNWMLEEIDLSAQRVKQKIKVAIPRFLAFDETKNYFLTLRELHAKLTPEYKPNFSGISETQGLAFSAIYNRLMMSVDELGSGRQPVTDDIDKMKQKGTPRWIRFNANRPFFFSLVLRSTKRIVFLGHVTDPMTNLVRSA